MCMFCCFRKCESSCFFLIMPSMFTCSMLMLCVWCVFFAGVWRWVGRGGGGVVCIGEGGEGGGDEVGGGGSGESGEGRGDGVGGGRNGEGGGDGLGI